MGSAKCVECRGCVECRLLRLIAVPSSTCDRPCQCYADIASRCTAACRPVERRYRLGCAYPTCGEKKMALFTGERREWGRQRPGGFRANHSGRWVPEDGVYSGRSRPWWCGVFKQDSFITITHTPAHAYRPMTLCSIAGVRAVGRLARRCCAVWDHHGGREQANTPAGLRRQAT